MSPSRTIVFAAYLGISALTVPACSASHSDCAGDCPDGSLVPTDGGGITRDSAGMCLAHAAARHRPSPSMCDHERPPGTSPFPGTPTECTIDADCTMGTNGRCNGNGHDGWRCTYDACFSDAECTSGTARICECEGEFRSDANVCLSGDCVTDADCASGFCSPTLGSCGDYTGTVGWFCHTCADTCVDDADCGAVDAGSFGRPYCAFDPMSGHWGCQSTHCVG